MRKATEVVHCIETRDHHTGAVSTPIYQTATFKHPALYESTGYDYSRTQNPTREALEIQMASLEEGVKAFAFSTGMAAVSATLGLLRPGDQLLVSDDLYGGTYRLLEEILRPQGVEAIYVDLTDTENLKSLFNPAVKAVWLETPTNPLMKVADISAIADLAHLNGAVLMVDNTFLSPYLQRPISLGADLVIHSGTKYLGGHNDTLAGFVIVAEQALAERIGFIQNTIGAVLSPFDSWLILRGIKTLALRMEKSQENALALAKWLDEHPSVGKVYYPGLEGHPGYELMKKQASGFGAMISFHVKEEEQVKSLLGKLKLIQFAESLGGVESLITYPLTQTHAAIPKDVREKIGVNETLLRFSVGIEALEDLIEDLEQAI